VEVLDGEVVVEESEKELLYGLTEGAVPRLLYIWLLNSRILLLISGEFSRTSSIARF
jgi:hypothetical protein